MCIRDRFWGDRYYQKVLKTTHIKSDLEEINKINRLSHERKLQELQEYFEKKLGKNAARQFIPTIVDESETDSPYLPDIQKIDTQVEIYSPYRKMHNKPQPPKSEAVSPIASPRSPTEERERSSYFLRANFRSENLTETKDSMENSRTRENSLFIVQPVGHDTLDTIKEIKNA
eukprot:TRINITY_DN9204_c0_g1_i1.p1 TRINITY_DN9204_c0_g1~~TRINITY_DN9204_c0_g1_i1.p1  ORF type:complete len:197 (+),score=45.43 TRINITY_DN9204_c0_g1_i1:74-592(+)